MSRFHDVSDDDHQPLTWVQGRPVYAAHFIVAVLVAAMLATTLLLALEARRPLALLAFDSAAVFSGQVWRVLTCGFVQPPGLGLVLDLVLLAWFGREVEKDLGRRSFLRLYLCLQLLPPLALLAVGFWIPQTFSGQTGALAVFVAFATLYPGAGMIFNLLAGWVAAILVGLYTLVALASRDWPGLVALWSTTGFAFAYVRHFQGRLSLPELRLPRRASSSSARGPEPRGHASRPAPRSPAADDMAEIDALLDKINRSGLDSLTPGERERLAAAQARFARRNEKPRG